MKFNIGDKVKIRKDIVIGAELRDVEFLIGMKEDADDDLIFEIEEIYEDDNTYRIKEINDIDNNWWMPEEWLMSISNEIKIKYMHEDLEKLDFIGGKSDWIDLRCASKEDIVLKAGEFKLIPLGVAMELPEGYEAHVVPRSSTYKHYGIIQTNSVCRVAVICRIEVWAMVQRARSKWPRRVRHRVRCKPSPSPRYHTKYLCGRWPSTRYASTAWATRYRITPRSLSRIGWPGSSIASDL